MALSACGVNMPRAAEPSGRASWRSLESPGRARQVPAVPSRTRPLRVRKRRRFSMASIPLALALGRDRLVVLFDQVLVFGHVLFTAGIGIHLRPQRFGQVSPSI